jgi:hypothetical protein
MQFLIFANAVLVLHLLWILFMIGGPFLLSFQRLRIFHAAALLAIVVMEVLAVPCPLTHLEEWLIRRQDPSFSYGGSLIQYYLIRMVYPDLPSSIILWASFLWLWVTFGLFVWKNPLKELGKN